MAGSIDDGVSQDKADANIADDAKTLVSNDEFLMCFLVETKICYSLTCLSIVESINIFV